MGSDIVVVLEIFSIPHIVVNLFFRTRYSLMKCQHMQNAEFSIYNVLSDKGHILDHGLYHHRLARAEHA